MTNKEFTNKGIGRCIILKENQQSAFKLIYAIDSDMFIIISGLNKETGNWNCGHYYMSNLKQAVLDYDSKIKAIEEIRDSVNTIEISEDSIEQIEEDLER